MMWNVTKLGCVSQDIDFFARKSSVLRTEEKHKILEIRSSTAVFASR